MKLTKEQLKQIIKEELKLVMQEEDPNYVEKTGSEEEYQAGIEAQGEQFTEFGDDEEEESPSGKSLVNQFLDGTPED